MSKDVIINMLDAFFDFLVQNYSNSNNGFFSKSIIFLYEGLKGVLISINPIFFIILISLICFLFLKRSILFSILPGFLFILYFDLWEISMDTVAIIFVSVFFSLLIGIPIGIIAGYCPKFFNFLKVILDFMQAMPPFIYLIPAIPFFGMGTIAAIFATVIFAMPPLIRYTRLGIIQVSQEVIEAAKSFGSSDLRILLRIQIPLSLQSIIEGMNQSIMMAISMIVIAAMVGSSGLGKQVIYSVQRLAFGEGLVSGLAVVSIAVILDRVMRAIFIRFSYLNTSNFKRQENKFKKFLELYNNR